MDTDSGSEVAVKCRNYHLALNLVNRVIFPCPLFRAAWMQSGGRKCSPEGRHWYEVFALSSRFRQTIAGHRRGKKVEVPLVLCRGMKRCHSDCPSTVLRLLISPSITRGDRGFLLLLSAFSSPAGPCRSAARSAPCLTRCHFGRYLAPRYVAREQSRRIR
jgi:hypothetical protein